MEKAKITPILKPNKENKPVGNIPSQSVLEKREVV